MTREFIILQPNTQEGENNKQPVNTNYLLVWVCFYALVACDYFILYILYMDSRVLLDILCARACARARSPKPLDVGVRHGLQNIIPPRGPSDGRLLL